MTQRGSNLLRWARRLGAFFIGATFATTMVTVGVAQAATKGSRQASAAKTLKVAVLTPGEKNDGSWGQAVATGATKAAKKYKVKLSLDQGLTGSSAYQQAAAAYATKGYKLVVIANGSYPTTVTALAKQFPKTWFCEEAVNIPNPPSNVCTVTPTFYDGDFLAGALAGMLTKSGVVGEIGGFSFPVLNWEMNGFALGARYMNPKVTVKVDYVNTWTTVATTHSAAEAQITGGADVLFSATDQATEGIYSAAQAKQGTYAVSQYFPTYNQAPSVVLTSVLFNLQGATSLPIQNLVQGKLSNQNYVLTYKKGAGKLAPFHQFKGKVVTSSMQKRLTTLEHWIASGKLKVPALGGEKAALTYKLTQLPTPPSP